jgi:homoserine O-acetyltransferase/O-succinyltransferase
MYDTTTTNTLAQASLEQLTDLLPTRPVPVDPKRQFRIQPGLLLEQGAYLLEPTITYHTYGDPGKPVVWVCHALTANSDVFDWWAGLFGEQDLFNPRDFYIVCANILGSCYGTEGPLSVHPYTGEPYYHDFPQVSIRDMVQAHEALRQHLGIGRIHLLLGGSLGGQQALEWAIQRPEVFDHLAVLATNARHSAWGIAFNEAQRMAIRADGTWQEARPDAGDAGMRAARAAALLSYRHYATYAASQTDTEPVLTDYRAVTYQQYQGEKLSKRFNAFSYYRLSEAMDTHHLGRGRQSIESALQQITARTLVLAIDTDVLFPPEEQHYIAEHIPGSTYQVVESIHGHDGFLIETTKLSALLADFLSLTPSPGWSPV